MARLLIRHPVAFLLALAAHAAGAQGLAPELRHRWMLDVDLGYAAGSSALGPWPDGELGKLRYDASNNELVATRLVLDYGVRFTPTLEARLVADYVDDASNGVDFTEAFLDWRPVPRSALRHRFRFGALYPDISLENTTPAWTNPFTTSSSAINSWLGEEIRPLAIEWSGAGRPGIGSPHELGAFAAAFYANDPAGTLLFWRGFSLHDRQTRFNDRLALPPLPMFGPAGIEGYTPQQLEPFEEIDHRPGYYAGAQWQYAKRARVQLASLDNRAAPDSYADGRWSWRTKFRQLAAQVELPGRTGVVAQWLRGETYWYINTGPDGSLTPASELVRDDFDAYYVLLTKQIGQRQRITLRRDRFEIERRNELGIDDGRAWTLAYRFALDGRMTLTGELLRIRSKRGLWEAFYGLSQRAEERQVRLQWQLRIGAD